MKTISTSSLFKIDEIHKVLYVFFSHQDNINNVYDRIIENMRSLNNNNFIIVQGSVTKNSYNYLNKILSINCNDKYEGLPEKVIKTFKFIVENKAFDKYTHFIKLDDDMVINKIPLYNIIKKYDYTGGKILYSEGSRTWHLNRCSENSYWNKKKYDGKFVPWCLGGYGYCVSLKALKLVVNDTGYKETPYEDVYISLLLKQKNISPQPMDSWKTYFSSPDHK